MRYWEVGESGKELYLSICIYHYLCGEEEEKIEKKDEREDREQWQAQDLQETLQYQYFNDCRCGYLGGRSNSARELPEAMRE